MTPAQLFAYRLSLFEGVTESDLAHLPLDVTEQRLTASQILFHQHDLSFDVFFLLSGDLMTALITADGREIVFSRFVAGAYFGEVAAIDGKPRSLTVMAKTDATLLVMQRASFLAILDAVPAVRSRIMDRLVYHIRNLTERSIEMATLTVEQRVGAFILRLAAEQGTTTPGTIINPAPTHAEIAGAVGANREMVSRSISRLARQGLISAARQKIEVIDPAALADLLA